MQDGGSYLNSGKLLIVTDLVGGVLRLEFFLVILPLYSPLLGSDHGSLFRQKFVEELV